MFRIMVLYIPTACTFAGAAVDAVLPWLLDSARQVMLLLTRRVSAPGDRW
jgi:hypothetical protein